MPSKKRTDTEAASAGNKCPLCWKQPGQDVALFQNKRHQHFLTFPHGNELESHLLEQYGEERVKDGGIKATMAWYYGKKDDEWRNRPQMAIDGREQEDAPEPIWDDDRED